MTAMKVDLVGEPVKAKYVPSEEVLGACYDMGKAISARLGGAA
jgi:hypothetical protein